MILFIWCPLITDPASPGGSSTGGGGGTPSSTSSTPSRLTTPASVGNQGSLERRSKASNGPPPVAPKTSPHYGQSERCIVGYVVKPNNHFVNKLIIVNMSSRSQTQPYYLDCFIIYTKSRFILLYLSCCVFCETFIHLTVCF